MKWVRTEAFLAIIAMAMAFTSGALVLSVKDGPPASISTPALEQEIQRFLKNTAPASSFSIDEIREFINPASLLPIYYKFDFAEVQALRKFSQDCTAPKIKKSAALQKAWQWQLFKCGQGKLSGSFFDTPPFFHPAGYSYAYLNKTNPEWIFTHLNKLHVLELRQLGIKSLPPPLDLLAPLKWEQLASLSNGVDFIRTEFYVLAAKNDDSVYQVFDILDWNRFWKNTPFEPQTEKENAKCSIRQNDLCWSYDLKLAYFPNWNPLVILLLLAILLTGLLFWMLAARISKRMRDERRLQFALEMLAHEIRTPLSNLAFVTENFRSHFDSFPSGSQSDLLRLFDQVERLKHVAETSSRYLSKDITAPLLEPKFTQVSSLTSFIEHTLDPYMSQIELKIEDNQQPLRTDPYWASICIKNLVENAVKHGVKPVRVHVIRTTDQWTIQVEDQGTKEFELKKSEHSQGLGLGLKLIQEIMPQIKGALSISFNPTRMTLTFTENA